MARQLIMLYTCTQSYFNCMYSCTVVYTISLELSVHSYTLLLTETLCEVVQTLAGQGIWHNRKTKRLPDYWFSVRQQNTENVLICQEFELFNILLDFKLSKNLGIGKPNSSRNFVLLAPPLLPYT